MTVFICVLDAQMAIEQMNGQWLGSRQVSFLDGPYKIGCEIV